MAGAAIQITPAELAQLLDETDAMFARTFEDVASTPSLNPTWVGAFSAFAERWWSDRERYGMGGALMHEPDLEQLRLYLLHLLAWQRQARKKGVELHAPLNARQLRVAQAVGLHMLVEKPIVPTGPLGTNLPSTGVSLAIVLAALAVTGALIARDW